MIPYKFRIEVTTMCPYRCSYCIQSNRSNVSPNARPSDAKFTFCVNYINNTDLPAYHITLVGGEPSMCDIEGIFDRFIDECPNKNISFDLITNLYKSPEYYARLNNYNISKWNVAFHETETTLEEFKKRVIAISSVPTIITFVCTEDNISMAQQIYDELNPYGKVKFVPVKDGIFDKTQSDEFNNEFNRLQQLPNIFPYYDNTDYICKNRVCSGTMYQLSIRYDGRISCSPSCNVTLGNVYSNPMPLFVDRAFIRCTANNCRMCGGQIHLITSKEKDLCRN